MNKKPSSTGPKYLQLNNSIQFFKLFKFKKLLVLFIVKYSPVSFCVVVHNPDNITSGYETRGISKASYYRIKRKEVNLNNKQQTTN